MLQMGMTGRLREVKYVPQGHTALVYLIRGTLKFLVASFSRHPSPQSGSQDMSLGVPMAPLSEHVPTAWKVSYHGEFLLDWGLTHPLHH